MSVVIDVDMTISPELLFYVWGILYFVHLEDIMNARTPTH